MPLDRSSAPDFALLAMYAEDMHRSNDAGATLLAPPIDDRIAKDGWEPRAYLAADDSILPKKAAIKLFPQRLYYGFVAQNRADPSLWVVAIRGTAGVAEWIIDGQFAYEDHPRGGAGTEVEHGFWGIYSSMALTSIADGTTSDDDAARGISNLVGVDSVTVVGHSLGSALATYLSFDLADRLGGRASAFMFASPRTGNKAWADVYHAALRDRYLVLNYILDIVPRLPARPDYVDLPSVYTIRPSTAEAGIKVDVLSNHHVLCYCAMLSYARYQAARPNLKPVDTDAKGCVLGDSTTVLLQAKLLEKAVDGVESAGLSVSKLFRAMLDYNLA